MIKDINIQVTSVGKVFFSIEKRKTAAYSVHYSFPALRSPFKSKISAASLSDQYL